MFMLNGLNCRSQKSTSEAATQGSRWTILAGSRLIFYFEIIADVCRPRYDTILMFEVS